MTCKGQKKYYEPALDIKLKKLGPKHVLIARTHHLLGMVQRASGDLQKAKKHYYLALDITMNKLGPDHVTVADTHNELGNVQRDLGDLQRAKGHFKRALDIELKRLGLEHIDVAPTYHELATVHQPYTEIRNPRLKRFNCGVDDLDSEVSSVYRDDDCAKCCTIS